MPTPNKGVWVGRNYLNDNTRMEVPPAYWLQRLYDFDAELVVFPSRFRPTAYVLARRQRFSAGMRDKALESTITQPDTKLCLEHNLVPVTMIYRTGVGWSIDNIIASLQARDIWALGGGEKAATILDEHEAKLETAQKAQVRSDMWARSGQAWESYKRRTGQRVSVPGVSSERPLPTTRSSGSTVGLGRVQLTDG